MRMLLWDQSQLLQLLNEAKNRLVNRLKAPGSMIVHRLVAATPAASDQAWVFTDALIESMAREIQAAGFRFAVVSASSPEQLWPRHQQRPADPFAQEPRQAALLAARSIPYLPLAPTLQRQADQASLLLHGLPGQAPGEGHWNATGHRLAAEAILSWLYAVR